MTHDEIKSFIAEQTCAGLSLSQIQDKLTALGVKLSFMEVRLIAAEIETSFWENQDAKNEKPKAPEKPIADTPADMDNELPEEEFASDTNDDYYSSMTGKEPEAAPAKDTDAPGLRGKTSVTVNKIQRPGFAATGSVTFGSGASGDWCLDQYGRLMFEKLNGKPDEQDIQEFQLELQRAFGA